MDHFEPIDMETWPRAEIYKQYTQLWTTVTYTFTKKLDVTKLVPYLKQRGIKLIPALVWLSSRAVNSVENFRLGIQNEALVRWDMVHPLVPAVNSTGNMSFHSLRHNDSFPEFYAAYLAEQQEFGDRTNLWTNGPAPDNYFFVSVLPWLEYDSLSMQLKNAKGYYAPYVAMGKYNERMELPCTIMVNHATIDGLFVHQFYEHMQQAMDDPAGWCVSFL